MKLIIQKATNFKETNKVIEILSTDINNNIDTYFIKSNETLIIKYSDTEEQFLVKDIQSNIVYDNNSETLVTISDTDLLPLGGSKGDSRPYKVYTALLTQSGTNAPVATILENTLGGIPIFTYDGVGIYTITLTGLLTANKRTFNVFTTRLVDAANGETVESDEIIEDDNSIQFITYSEDISDAGIPANGWTKRIEIRVYN